MGCKISRVEGCRGFQGLQGIQTKIPREQHLASGDKNNLCDPCFGMAVNHMDTLHLDRFLSSAVHP